MYSKCPTRDLESLSRESAPFVDVDIAPDGLAMIMLQAETTGDPKGVMLTHAKLMANLEASSQWLSVKYIDLLLSILL